MRDEGGFSNVTSRQPHNWGGGGSPAFCRYCSKSASAAAAKSGKYY